jgi:hypothetical protein
MSVEYGENTQIVALYDKETSLTVETVAAMFQRDVEAIKFVLAAGSQRYRQETKEKPELFSQDDDLLARETIKQLCYAENEGVRLKAALSIVDERRGRRDVKKDAKTIGTININVFNQHLQKGRERLKRIKGEVVEQAA